MKIDHQPPREPASGPRFGPSYPPIRSNHTNHLNESENERVLHQSNFQDTTLTTPRPNTAPNIQPQPMHGGDDATTPTTAKFPSASGALADQRPLPPGPFDIAASVPDNVEALQSTLTKGPSTKPNTKTRRAKNADGDVDVDMDESNNEDGKKNKIFLCEGFLPCRLSFTRHEHLLRHIRKHTGERPFTCHCMRKFSRMDNLRQHAQTVHVNEPIPPDSLAATSTRYPRQPRNDKMKASKAATDNRHARKGHQRNAQSLSAIGTMASTYSPTNGFTGRPSPLQMPSYGLNSPSAYPPNSPAEYTPTSATFSNGQNSPRFPSGLQSPMAGPNSRVANLYDDHSFPIRRSSVSSVVNLSSHRGPAYHNTGSPQTYPHPSGMVSSPTNSMAAFGHARRESMPYKSDMDIRRKTWHPDSFDNYSRRVQYVATSNHPANGPVPRPTAILPSNALPVDSFKLPPISSFDLPRPSSPMQVDRPNSYHQPNSTAAQRQARPSIVESNSYHQPNSTAAQRQARPSIVESNSYNQPRQMQTRDRPLSSHLDREFGYLNLRGDAASWASDTERAVHATAEKSQVNPPRVMFDQSTNGPRSRPTSAYHHHTASAPVNTFRSSRSDVWPSGPSHYQLHESRFQGSSPEGSSSPEGAAPVTPQSSSNTDYHPVITRTNGYPEETPREFRSQQQPIIHHYHAHPNGSEPLYAYGPPSSHQPTFQPQQAPKLPEQPANMTRLNALAAVAISDQPRF